jgi:transposase
VLNLTMKEAERYKVISEVEGGYLKVKEGAEILGLSERQVYRIKGRVEREGAGGVIHRAKVRILRVGLGRRSGIR